MTVIVINTRAITFSNKSKTFYLESKLRDSYISRTNCIKDQGILCDSKFYCHFYVEFIFLNHSGFVSHL
jgi:hypothetical protein